MVQTIEKSKDITPPETVMENAIRQKGKVNLNIFNYCFLAYYYLINEIKKNAHYAKGILIDVGCGSAPFEEYFSEYIEKYQKHEHPESIKRNLSYDYLSELPKINVPDNYFDTVVCFSVLEHVNKPFESIKEFKRILKKDGILILSVPQYWHLHDEPHDYFRFTKYILNEKIPELGFEVLYLKELGRSFSVVGQSFCNALILLFNLEHVKNIFDFLSGKSSKTSSLTKSIIYAIYMSPLIFLSIILIPIINVLFLTLDKLAGSPRDTLGHFLVAKKT